jgi:hypothetical protein
MFWIELWDQIRWRHATGLRSCHGLNCCVKSNASIFIRSLHNLFQGRSLLYCSWMQPCIWRSWRGRYFSCWLGSPVCKVQPIFFCSAWPLNRDLLNRKREFSCQGIDHWSLECKCSLQTRRRIEPSFIHSFIHVWLYSPMLDLGRLFSFSVFYTVDRSPWTGDQPIGRPLPTRRTAETEKMHTDIHASSGNRTHGPSVWAGEGSSCLRPRRHCDRLGALIAGRKNLRTADVIVVVMCW